MIKEVVGEESAGKRLDVYLRDRFEELSRAKIKELFERGEVAVNDRRVAASYRVQPGDSVSLVHAPRAVAARGDLAGELSLEVLFEDEHLCIVEKPFGVHCVRLHPEDPPTVADALAAYREEFVLASPDLREAGLLQRLDYYTTGVLLAAKTPEAHTVLRELFANEQVQKSYLVITEGALRGRRKVSKTLFSAGERMTWQEEEESESHKGLEAETRVLPLRVCDEGERCYSVVRAEMSRGRRHQVRAHLASINAPLLGDALYGAKTTFLEYPHLAERVGLREGFFLNAERIRFLHPYTGVRVDVRSTNRGARGIADEG